MDTDELYEDCIITFRELGIGEEAQELTETYIRQNTYLTDRPSQNQQILEIWHRCREAIQQSPPAATRAAPAATQSATSSGSAGQSWRCSHQRSDQRLTKCTGPSAAAPSSPEASSANVAATQAATSPIPQLNTPSDTATGGAATSRVSSSNPAIVITSSSPAPSSPSRQANTPTPAGPTPASTEPSSRPAPSAPHPRFNPEVPSFYPWWYLGLPARPTPPHLLPQGVQHANYSARLQHEDSAIGSLDRRIAAAQQQINEIKAAQAHHAAEVQAAFDYIEKHRLDETKGVGRHKMLHAQWSSEQEDKKTKELKKKMEEKAKLVEQRNENFMDMFPGEGEMGPKE
ncbi:MAG: hypothetical protein Q9202_003954 [Teloschistes flavicans]